MVVHDHEMWVDVESDKKMKCQSLISKLFKERIGKRLKVKEWSLLSVGNINLFLLVSPLEWIWIEITSIEKNGMYMGIASNEPSYE